VVALAVLLTRVVLVGSDTWTGQRLVIFDYPDRSVPDRLFRLQAGLRAVTASGVARGRVTR
jgi:hypothetical protein